MVLRVFGAATSRWTVVVNDCQWVFEMNQMQLNGSVVSRSTPRTVDCAPKDVVKRRYGGSLYLQQGHSLPSVTFIRYVDGICQMPIITKKFTDTLIHCGKYSELPNTQETGTNPSSPDNRR